MVPPEGVDKKAQQVGKGIIVRLHTAEQKKCALFFAGKQRSMLQKEFSQKTVILGFHKSTPFFFMFCFSYFELFRPFPYEQKDRMSVKIGCVKSDTPSKTEVSL